MKKRLIVAASFLAMTAFMVSCGGGQEGDDSSNGEEAQSMLEEVQDYDPKRGEGKFDDSNVTLGALNASSAEKGASIAGTKCMSCHKMTEEKLVGPGWAGVTKRRSGPWIMNFITNPDPMIDKDPEVQAQLELCLVRMPNQSLTDNDARDILEHMRQIDGVK
jgi:cytochrome c553